MSKIDVDIRTEAKVLGRYLVSSDISDVLIDRYQQGLFYSKIQEDETHLLFLKCIKNPFLLPYFDAAFALKKPNSSFRKRIFLMLAILEATPDYAYLFLEKEEGLFGFLRFFGNGIRAVYRAIIGLILFKFYL